MIDYEKLKLAHEICLKFGYSFSYFFGGKDINNSFGKEKIDDNWLVYDLDSGSILYDGLDIDALINVLREITSPKCKCGNPLIQDRNVCDECIHRAVDAVNFKHRYELGSTWWFLDEADFMQYPEPKSLLITEENKNRYRNEGEWFSSKQSLINEMIKYWQSISDEPQYCGVSGVKLGKSLANSDASLANSGCIHEPQRDFVHPGSPGIKKGRVQMCIKCNEEYFDE